MKDMPAMPMPKEEARAGATWSAKGIGADVAHVALGDRVRVVLEGVLTGHSMQEYGCSIDLKPDSVSVEKIAGATAAAVKKLHHRMKGEEY